MRIHYSRHPSRYLLFEPMTDPPWIRSPFSVRGWTMGSGPP